MILCDWQIKELVFTNHPMIEPFAPRRTEVKISNGLSSFGYDLTLDTDIRFIRSGTIDPLTFKQDVEDNKLEIINLPLDDKLSFFIPPHGFVLAKTVEYFKMPNNVMGICVGKSTYARCGLVVNVTPIEPGWEGYITLELSNTTDSNIRVYCNQGIAQLCFFRGSEPDKTYADKRGKYQGQKEVTYPKGD